jgi:hypothetical protein
VAFLLCLVSLLREKAKVPALAGLLVLGLGEGYHSPLAAVRASTPNFGWLTWMTGALAEAAMLRFYHKITFTFLGRCSLAKSYSSTADGCYEVGD